MTRNALHNIEQLESSLWEAADQLRANSKLTSSEYCMPLHRIVNEAIHAQTPNQVFGEPKFYDLSQIDLEKLRNEFAKKVKRKATALQNIRDLVEQKLAVMLAHNPQCMDYHKHYQKIIAPTTTGKRIASSSKKPSPSWLSR